MLRNSRNTVSAFLDWKYERVLNKISLPRFSRLFTVRFLEPPSFLYMSFPNIEGKTIELKNITGHRNLAENKKQTIESW